MAIATCIIAPKNIVTRICAEATAIPKGTVMKLSGTNLVIASSGDTDAYGGITIEEFKGGEGLTHVSCAYNDGVFQIGTTAAAIAVGELVNIGGANAVVLADAAAIITGSLVGKAEEARTETNSIRVRLTA